MRKFLTTILLVFGLLGFKITVWGQTAAFPYHIQVQTLSGQCYDDCRIIIDLVDDAGNVIPINPQTHNAQNTDLYPIYNIQYHYRNVSAGMNTQHDTVNNIQVSIGTYCIGITAYVPDLSIAGEYLLVDTSICNIEVTTEYEHLEASVLSTWARNDYETWNGREFCGFRPSFQCEDRGRIQLMLTKGKFPYTILILNAQQDTVRQEIFYQRAQTGTDSIYADYYDYYTFDHMAIGDYRILAMDSCGYSIWMTMNIPNIEPYNYRFYTRDIINCGDSNVLYFYMRRDANNLHDYDLPYVDSIIQYRFINPGQDTTAWYYPTYNGDYYQFDFNDTLRMVHDYCSLYYDTIILQFYNLCEDIIYNKPFFYSPTYNINYEILSTELDMDTSPDTCIIHTNSGLSTQTYNYYGTYRCQDCGRQIWADEFSVQEIPARKYSCPLSYDIWSDIDSTLIAHTESNAFNYLVAPVVFSVDTTIPVHITITDGTGCQLIDRHETFTFNVDSASDTHYWWESRGTWDTHGWSGCCWYRQFWIRENGVNAQLFRQNMTMRLFESPLYNRFNFTAVCQNGEWTLTCEDTTNHSTYVDFSSETTGWQATIHDMDCLAPGRYVFECITPCGIDTITYERSGFYKDSVAFTSDIQYEMNQICDRLWVRPTTVGVYRYEQSIDPAIDNNEPILSVDSANGYNCHVINGVAGGYNEWPNENGYFIFTLPGKYVIEYYSSSNCYTSYYYDTIEFVPDFIDFDLGYAIVCDYLTSIGNVLTHATHGTEPYTYYLYSQPDLAGSIITSSPSGYFYEIPMVEGQQFSVLVIDSCYNNYYINLTAASLSQSVLAWEYGDNVGNGHCEGDTVHLTALPFTFQADYHWTGPNGFVSNTRVNDFVIPYNGVSGWYTLEILNTGCTTSITDSVFIQVIRAPRVTIFSDSIVCPGTDANIGFAVQGNGPVDFSIYHIGAPNSGSESLTVNANDTLFLQYPILSDNIFWADNISDHVCSYHYLIDSTSIAIQHIYNENLPILNTTDGYACYGHAATLSVIAPFSTPYYVIWYNDALQEYPLKCDTITQASTPSFCQIDQLTSDTTLYVSVSNESHCPRLYGNFYYLVDMHNGNTILNAGECARLFDSGGENHNYGNNEHLTYTFTGLGVEKLNIMLNLLDLAIGDTLYLYSGNTANPDSLIISINNNTIPYNFTVQSSTVTFVFNSNWTNNREGWNIDILTEIPMTEVHGFISPINYDTIVDFLCPSLLPYQVAGVPDINISQPMDYVLDTLLIIDGTCQTQLHLHLTVKATSATSIQDSLMPCQLPHIWNGVSFTDYGTQNAVLTNAVGCDSIVTMTLLWAPPVDSTTVFDTIVENQLPYQTNGLTFNGPGMQIATLSNTDGCDSVVTVYLYVHYNVTAEADSVICDDVLPFLWNGVSFTASDTQTVLLTASTGADSTLTMHLTVLPTSHTQLYDTICQYDEYSEYGFNLSGTETSAIGSNTFTLVLTNQYNCDSVILLDLLITPDVSPEFEADPDRVMLSEGGTIPLFNRTDMSNMIGIPYYWIWDFGDGTGDTTTEYDNSHTYEQWGDYDVTLKLVANHCETEVTHTVYVEADLIFPNVITPNGDGVNDVFIIKDLNPERENELLIYDRWGREVFHQKNYQTYMRDDKVFNTSDGFGTDPKLNEGTFFFSFNYKGMVKTVNFHGTVTIIRNRN